MLSSFSLRRRPTSLSPTASSMSRWLLLVPRPHVGPLSKRGYGDRRRKTSRGLGRPANGLAHLAHRALHPHESGPRHDAVPDVELHDLGDGGDSPHVLVV